MGCSLPFKIILIAVNIGTILLGLAFMVIGGMMIWGQSIIQQLIYKALGSLNDTMDPSNENITNLATRILTVVGPLGIAIFVVGIFITLASVIGFIGACCYKIFLYIYAGLMAALAIAVLAIFIYYHVNKGKISDKLADLYANSVRKYVSLVTNNEDSLIVLLVQGQLKCCGDHSNLDFVNFSPKDGYDGTLYDSLTAPIPCCKMNEEYEITHKTCPKTFNKDNSNLNTGCRQPVKKMLEDNLNTISYVLIGMFVILLILMIFAILGAVCQ